MHAVRDGYLVSDDRSLLDFAVIHGFLTRSYWSPGIPRETVERAARHSLPVGLYRSAASNQQRQIGYMRLLTDFSVFAYVLDVFVLEDFRGQGLARWMVQDGAIRPGAPGRADVDAGHAGLAWAISEARVHGGRGPAPLHAAQRGA